MKSSNVTEQKRYEIRRKRMPGDSYEKDCDRFYGGLFGGLFFRLRPGTAAMMRGKMRLAAFSENLLLTKLLSRFVRRFLATRVRSSSVGILCFGFLCAAITLFRLFLGQLEASVVVMDLAFSLGVILATLPLALSRSTWSEVLSRSLLGSLWFDLLGGFRSDELKQEEEYAHGGRFSLIAGVGMGLLCFFLSPVTLAFSFLAVLIVGQIFYKPELGVSLLALSFAFLSEQALLAMALIVLLSYLWKGLRGKRVFAWEPVDAFALFLLLVWAGGVGLGLTKVHTLLLGAMLYLLFSKLVLTSRQAHRLSYVFVIVLFSFSFLFTVRLWAMGDGAELVERLGALFLSEQGGFVVPLDIVMMLLPIAAVGAMQKGAIKLFSVVALSLGLCALLFSTSPGALFCLALSLAVLVILLRKRMLFVFCALAVVVAAVAVFSPTVLSELFANVPALVQNALAEQERILVCVFSRDWFQILFGSFSLSVENLNFWGGFLYRFGLTGLFAFVLFLVFLFRKAMGVWYFTKETRTLRLCFGLQLSLGMLLVRGITSPFTDNTTVFAFFWLVCGMICAVANVARSSRSREEM